MGRTASRTGTEGGTPEGGLTGKPGRRAYTRELYDALVVGFRLAPANAAHAARTAGCERRAAKRAWEQGWRGLRWARPIRDVLAEEGQAARARHADVERQRREAADARAEAARVEAVESEAQERSMVKAARQDVLASAVVAAELVPAMRALAGVVRNAVLDPITGRPLAAPAVDPKAAMMMMSRWSGMVGKTVYAAEALVQLGRLDRGQPNAVIGHAEVELSPEQTEEELVAGVELLARLRGVDPARVSAFLDELQGVPGEGGARGGALALPASTAGLGEETNGQY